MLIIVARLFQAMVVQKPCGYDGCQLKAVGSEKCGRPGVGQIMLTLWGWHQRLGCSCRDGHPASQNWMGSGWACEVQQTQTTEMHVNRVQHKM